MSYISGVQNDGKRELTIPKSSYTTFEEDKLLLNRLMNIFRKMDLSTILTQQKKKIDVIKIISKSKRSYNSRT